MLRSLALLTLLAVLAGCAADRNAALAEQAQTALLGLSEEQVLACAGNPVERAREGGNTLLVYFAEISRRVAVSTPAAPMPIGLPEPQPHFTYYRFCETSFVLKGGRVAELRMKGRTDTGRETLDACAQTVMRCMKGKAGTI